MGVPGLHPHTKSRHCGFKNMGLQPQNRQNWYFFGIKFAKFGMGKGVPGSLPHAKFHRCGFKL